MYSMYYVKEGRFISAQKMMHRNANLSLSLSSEDCFQDPKINIKLRYSIIIIIIKTSIQQCHAINCENPRNYRSLENSIFSLVFTARL